MLRLDNFKGRIKALDSLWLAYEQEESYENAMQTLEQMLILLEDARGYEAELQCVMAEKDRLQHFFKVEKDITKGLYTCVFFIEGEEKIVYRHRIQPVYGGHFSKSLW